MKFAKNKKIIVIFLLIHKHVQHAFVNKISTSFFLTFSRLILYCRFKPRAMNVVLFNPSRETAWQYVFMHKFLAVF